MAVVVLAVLLSVLSSGGLQAQEPPDTVPAADSLAADSLQLPDSLQAADSLLADSLQAQADSVSPDTIYYNLPELRGDVPAGFARGVWVWDHEEIMASGANTLVELLARLPGMVPLRAGDYGTPLGLSAFGMAGGAVRVYRDGVEVTPLAGSVADLQRVGLGGVQEIRFERHPGELVIHLRSVRYDDGRPFSLVEAGTGDLDTNLFRGTFANPTALGGSVALALERADTRGPGGNETGNRSGTWVRYQLHRGDRAGLALDFRRMSTETAVELYPSATTRTDWSVRGRADLGGGLTGEAYWASSSYEVDDTRAEWEGEGGSRSQLGARMAWARDGLFARGAYRRFGGEDLPGDRLELAAGADLPRVGGASAAWERAGWPEGATSATRIQGWTAPLLGFSLFGSWESGTRGARTGPLRRAESEPDTAADETPDAPAVRADLPLLLQEQGDSAVPPPLFGVVDRTATRYGAQWSGWGVTVAGAFLEVESDSLLPTALPFDRDEPALAGGTRSGWEAWGRVPVPILDGLHLEGSLQQWEEGWPYLAERIYRGSFVYHKTFLESGNLELDWRLGVRGRDPMAVHRVVESEEVDEETGEPLTELASVPFYQSWYATLQVRVVTVRIFIGWENLAVRRNLQDLPDRVLPATRAMYGIRWTLWN